MLTAIAPALYVVLARSEVAIGHSKIGEVLLSRGRLIVDVGDTGWKPAGGWAFWRRLEKDAIYSVYGGERVSLNASWWHSPRHASTGAAIPFWVLAMFGLGFVMAGCMMHLRQKGCPHCGYDRVGLRGLRCPECGRFETGTGDNRASERRFE